MATASRVTDSNPNAVIRARNIDIDQGPTGTTIDPGANIRNFICKNVGANPIKINFNGQAASEYWTLGPGEVLPVTINIIASTTILARGVTGPSVLECILWG